MTRITNCTSWPRNNWGRGLLAWTPPSLGVGVPSRLWTHLVSLVLSLLAHHRVIYSESLCGNGRSHAPVASVRWVWPLQRRREMVRGTVTPPAHWSHWHWGSWRLLVVRMRRMISLHKSWIIALRHRWEVRRWCPISSYHSGRGRRPQGI